MQFTPRARSKPASPADSAGAKKAIVFTPTLRRRPAFVKRLPTKRYPTTSLPTYPHSRFPGCATMTSTPADTCNCVFSLLRMYKPGLLL